MLSILIENKAGAEYDTDTWCYLLIDWHNSGKKITRYLKKTK